MHFFHLNFTEFYSSLQVVLGLYGHFAFKKYFKYYLFFVVIQDVAFTEDI